MSDVNRERMQRWNAEVRNQRSVRPQAQNNYLMDNYFGNPTNREGFRNILNNWAASSHILPQEYFAAGKRAGLEGKPLINMNYLSPKQESAYAEGYYTGKSDRFTFNLLDKALMATGAYELGRLGIFAVKKVGGYVAEKAIPYASKFSLFKSSKSLGGERLGKGRSIGAARRPDYEPAPYHGKVDNATKSRAPKNGQDALDVSVQVKSTSPRRVGIDHETGEFVVFDKTRDNVYHGHVRSWDELHPDMQRALQEAGMVNRRGKKIQ